MSKDYKINEKYCAELLEEGHKLFQKSAKTFDESDRIINVDVRKHVVDAIELLKEKNRLDLIGFDDYVKAHDAMKMYEKDCTFDYDENSSSCKLYLKRAAMFYERQDIIADDVQKMLCIILCKIDLYDEEGKQGDYFYKKWQDCQHKLCNTEQCFLDNNDVYHVDKK